MNTFLNLKRALSASVVTTVAASALIPATASAWKVNYDASSLCKDSTGAVSWTFKNTEPNEAKWSMDVEVTDAQTGGKTVKTVGPGETINGTFTSNKTKLEGGKVYFKMLWTDGRSGVDTRSSSYAATTECKPFVEPAFDASVVCAFVDNKAIYTLNVTQTTGNSVLTFAPSNDTKLDNGDPITVLGVYEKDGVTMKKTVTTAASADCTPPVEVKKISVCRNGAVIEINETDRLSTGTNAPCPEVKAVVTELPNTGAGSIAGLLGTTFAIGTGLSQFRMRRKSS